MHPFLPKTPSSRTPPPRSFFLSCLLNIFLFQGNKARYCVGGQGDVTKREQTITCMGIGTISRASSLALRGPASPALPPSWCRPRPCSRPCPIRYRVMILRLKRGSGRRRTAQQHGTPLAASKSSLIKNNYCQSHAPCRAANRQLFVFVFIATKNPVNHEEKTVCRATGPRSPRLVRSAHPCATCPSLQLRLRAVCKCDTAPRIGLKFMHFGPPCFGHIFCVFLAF